MRAITKISYFITVLFFAAVLFTASAHARGRCPDRAESLAAFAGCMVPVATQNGTVVGAMYVGTQAELDEDHRELMQAMNTQTVVPPQPMSNYGIIGYGSSAMVGYYGPNIVAGAYLNPFFYPGLNSYFRVGYGW